MGKNKKLNKKEKFVSERSNQQASTRERHDDAVLSRLEVLLSRKEKAGQDASPVALRTRCTLADAEMAVAGDYERAHKLLARAIELDELDEACARHLVAPALLRLGLHTELDTMLREWSAPYKRASGSLRAADGAAALKLAALLNALARWSRGEGTEEAATDALAAAFATNWHACVLLGAAQTSAGVPSELIDELRKVHPAGEKGPAAGGVEEALLLSCRLFRGWGGAAAEGWEDKQSAEERPAWPDLEGMTQWLCTRMVQQPPPEQVGVRGDARRLVARFEGVLEQAFGEMVEVACGDGSEEEEDDEEDEEDGWEGSESDEDEEQEEDGDEEGEEKEEEEDDGDDGEEEDGEDGEDGEDEEDEEDEEAAAARSAPHKRSREAFEEWRQQQRAKLQRQAARVARGEPPGSEDDSSGSDDGDDDDDNDDDDDDDDDDDEDGGGGGSGEPGDATAAAQDAVVDAAAAQIASLVEAAGEVAEARSAAPRLGTDPRAASQKAPSPLHQQQLNGGARRLVRPRRGGVRAMCSFVRPWSDNFA